MENKNTSSSMNFLLFSFFSISGILILVFEAQVLIDAYASGNIESLEYIYERYDAGVKTQGYAALIQHVAAICGGIVFVSIGVLYFRKLDIKLFKI